MFPSTDSLHEKGASAKFDYEAIRCPVFSPLPPKLKLVFFLSKHADCLVYCWFAPFTRKNVFPSSQWGIQYFQFNIFSMAEPAVVLWTQSTKPTDKDKSLLISLSVHFVRLSAQVSDSLLLYWQVTLLHVVHSSCKKITLQVLISVR